MRPNNTEIKQTPTIAQLHAKCTSHVQWDYMLFKTPQLNFYLLTIKIVTPLEEFVDHHKDIILAVEVQKETTPVEEYFGVDPPSSDPEN